MFNSEAEVKERKMTGAERWAIMEAAVEEVESVLEVALEEAYPDEWGAVNITEQMIEVGDMIFDCVETAAEDYTKWEGAR